MCLQSSQSVLRMSEIQPPRWIRSLLSRLCHPYAWESAEGDLHELFIKDIKQGKGKFRANVNYIRRSLAFLRFRRMLSLFTPSTRYNAYGMFKLQFKISIRNLLKHKMVSAMSLLTLVLGAVSFQLVYTWIVNEESMDKFHEHGQRIYIGAAQFTPQGELIAGHVERFFNLDFTEYPEVEKHLLIHNYQPGEIQLVASGGHFEGTALVTDSTFFDVFSFPMRYGNPHALSDPSSIMVTEQFAEKIWGDEYPIGKRVEIKCDQEGTYQVAAVLHNLPSNSSIQFDYLVPRHSQDFWRRMPQDLILLSEDASIQHFNAKVNLKVPESRFTEGSITYLPLISIYEDQPFSISLFAKYGDKTNYQVMQLVALALLLIMLFGFTNIQSTALLTETKKLGVKRVIGAWRRELVFEIWVNMFLYFLVATCLSFVSIQWVFERYTSMMELQLDNDWAFNLTMISLIIGLATLLTVMIQVQRVSGIKALEALTGKVNFFKAAYRQKVVTGIQYSVAISLLIATVMIYQQVSFMLNKETGLNQENIVQARFFEIIPSVRQDSVERTRILNQYKYVKDQLDQNPDILTVSHGQVPLDYAYTNAWRVLGSTDAHSPIKTITVDPAYREVFDLELVSGRFFTDSLDSNGEMKVVINEAAMKYWGIQDPLGVKIETDLRGGNETRKHTVIGVVKDFHFEHLSQTIKPLVMPFFYYHDRDMLIRHVPGRRDATVDFLDELYHEINGAGFFRAIDFENRVERQYLTEKKTNRIYLSFGLVTLFLSCISMFTFAFHETKRRTREIGIRKVNGATIRDIFQMFSNSFLTTVAIAFLIACPVVGYLMNHWLDNFANRINLEWWVFLMVGLFVGGMALLVITWHVLKVARINPVETLRCE